MLVSKSYELNRLKENQIHAVPKDIRYKVIMYLPKINAF